MCTPLPFKALRYAGRAAVNVLPSPVFISADATLMQNDAADNLYRERLDGEHAPHGFTARCKRFGQDVVKGRAKGEALFQHGGLALQLLICHFCVFVIEREHRLLKRFNAL